MKPTYEELEAKCQLQQNKLDAINKLMGVIESASDLAKDGIKKLEQQLAAVVEENAVLKSKGREVLNEACKVYEKLNATISSDSGDFIDGQTLHEFQFVLDVETPATDAAIANIQAQGVEMFAKILEGAADTCGKAKAWDAQENLIDFAERATGFATQLRQGAKS